jgi:hypothetical protein
MTRQTMTKRHFITLVGIIRQAKRDARHDSVSKIDMADKVQTALADFCECENAKFDRPKFIHACLS